MRCVDVKEIKYTILDLKLILIRFILLLIQLLILFNLVDSTLLYSHFNIKNY